MTFHGGVWHVTLEFTIEEAEDGRTRLAVDLSEPLGLIENLTSRLELADAEIR